MIHFSWIPATPTSPLISQEKLVRKVLHKEGTFPPCVHFEGSFGASQCDAISRNVKISTVVFVFTTPPRRIDLRTSNLLSVAGLVRARVLNNPWLWGLITRFPKETPVSLDFQYNQPQSHHLVASYRGLY